MRNGHIDPLRAFRLIAVLASFTRAAAELDVTASALSQTLRRLEQRLGMRLLNRTTRRVGLTEAGRDLLARIAPALGEIDAALDEARRRSDRPGGTLRLTVPQVAIPTLIEPNLSDFLRRYPELRVDIRVDSALNDLIAEGLDAGIRLGEKIQRDMVALPLGGTQRSVVVGAPAYFARHGKPRHPRELSSHNCVRFRFANTGPVYRWEFAHPSGAARGRWFEIDVEGNMVANDNRLVARAALDGIGLAHIMEISVRDHLAAGRLVGVLDAWLPAYDGFYLYYPRRFQVPAKLRVFADFLRARIAESSAKPKRVVADT